MERRKTALMVGLVWMAAASILVGLAVVDGAQAASAAPVASNSIIQTYGGGYLPDNENSLSRSIGRIRSLALNSTGGVDYIGSNVVWRQGPDGVLHILAGNGQPGFSGDGGQAKNALISPSAIFDSAAGNTYIADDGRVRKIDASGVITTVAGTGTYGYTGDNGPAVNAELGYVSALTVDSAENIFISDSNRVREITTAGTIHTIAGTGGYGYAGDNGPAVNAQFSGLGGLWVGTGNELFLADSGNQRIRRVTSGTITTFAGTGQAGLSGDGGPATAAKLNGPSAITGDGAGGILISDTYNNRLRRIAGGTITTIAGSGAFGGFAGDGGPATAATLSMPLDIARGPSGIIHFADAGNFRIRVIGTDGKIATASGNGTAGFSGDGGPATAAQISTAGGLAVDSDGNTYFADGLNARIRRIASDGTITTVAGTGVSGYSGDGGPAIAAKIGAQFGATAVAVDANGSIYFSDSDNMRVRRIDTNGIITTVAGTGVQGYSGDNGPATAASLDIPMGLAFDATGNLYIADHQNYRVRRVDPSGTISTIVGTGSYGNSGDGGPAASAKLSQPEGLTVDKFGNLFIADSGNNRIRKVALGTGVITNAVGSGAIGFSGDGGPAVTATIALRIELPTTGGSAGTYLTTDASGNLVFGDQFNYRVRRVTPAGIITTVVGTGTSGLAGDGGPALAANIGLVQGLSFDANGIMFISDGSRIRAIGQQAPSAARNATADPTGSTAVVSWSSPSSTGGSPVTGYTVTSNPENKSCTWATGPLTCTVTGLTAGTPHTFSVTATNALGTGPAVVAAPAGGGGFHPVVPSRVLDSRTVNGGWNAKLVAGVSRDLQVTGLGGGSEVPATASAVVMNTTVTGGNSGSFVSVWPAGQSQPIASNLNFGPGQTIPNLVTVKLGADGKVSFANAVGSVDVIADVVGYYDDGSGPGDLYNGITPSRLLDSRTVNGGWNAKLLAGAPRDLSVRQPGNTSGVPSTATAVIANVTVTGGTTGSFVSVWPSGVTQPNVSSLNFGPGQTIPNLVIVKIGANGAIRFANAVGGVDVIVDVVGYFDPSAGSRFHAINPTRILDDRVPTGLTGPWGPGQTRALPVTGAGTSVPAGSTGLVANVTVTGGTAGSFVTVFPDGVALPNSSNVNFGPGQTIPNLVTTKIAANGKIDFYNLTGAVDIIADAVGYYATT